MPPRRAAAATAVSQSIGSVFGNKELVTLLQGDGNYYERVVDCAEMKSRQATILVRPQVLPPIGNIIVIDDEKKEEQQQNQDNDDDVYYPIRFYSMYTEFEKERKEERESDDTKTKAEIIKARKAGRQPGNIVITKYLLDNTICVVFVPGETALLQHESPSLNGVPRVYVFLYVHGFTFTSSIVAIHTIASIRTAIKLLLPMTTRRHLHNAKSNNFYYSTAEKAQVTTERFLTNIQNLLESTGTGTGVTAEVIKHNKATYGSLFNAVLKNSLGVVYCRIKLQCTWNKNEHGFPINVYQNNKQASYVATRDAGQIDFFVTEVCSMLPEERDFFIFPWNEMINHGIVLQSENQPPLEKHNELLLPLASDDDDQDDDDNPRHWAKAFRNRFDLIPLQNVMVTQIINHMQVEENDDDDHHHQKSAPRGRGRGGNRGRGSRGGVNARGEGRGSSNGERGRGRGSWKSFTGRGRGNARGRGTSS